MPSGKKTKDDTWNEKELMKAIQGDTKETKRRSNGEKSSSSKEKTRDRTKEKDSDHAKDKDRDHRKEKVKDHTKDQPRDKDRDKYGTKHGDARGKTKENRSNKEEDDGDVHDKHRRHKTEEGDDNRDKERKHRRHKTEEGDDNRDKERKHRRHKTEEGDDHHDKERKHRRHKTEEGDDSRDKERKHHRHKTEEGVDNRDKERKHRRHKTEENGDVEKEKHSKHDNDPEHRKHKKDREDGKGSERKHREKNKDGRERRHGEEDERKEKGEKHKDREERGKDKEKVEKDKDREGSGHRKHEEREYRSHREDSKDKKHRSKDKGKEEIDRRQKEKEKVMPNASENSKETVDQEENYDYDDDFDDYDDDDFEDDDKGEESEDGNIDAGNSDEVYSSDENQKVLAQEAKLHLSQSDRQGVNEVLKAISAENEIAATQANNRSTSRPSTGEEKKPLYSKGNDDPPKKTFGKINFIAASQKQLTEKTAKKTKKRGQELLQLVQLDVRSIELFDMPPMTEYELYMKRFGQSDSKQTFTQTHDDDFTQETQTEEYETESKWCQFTHDVKACGSDDSDKTDMSRSINTMAPTSSVRLNKFLLTASQVCISLLEELQAGIEQPQRQYTESRGVFSDGYVTLESSNFLVLGRNFCDLAYSMSQTNMLLTAYGASNVVRKQHKSPKGLICLWNTNEPTKPLKLLTCESIPKSCCFSSGKASMAFAGMEDGVIAAWDLSEPASYHDAVLVGNTSHVFRTATFTTAALSENHMFPVVSVAPITSNASYHSESYSNDNVDMSFQLASLDQSGVINIWIVVAVESDSTDLNSVDDDLGLSPKGKSKLVKSATISPASTSVSSFANLFSVTCLQIDPTKPNHLYSGTDQGDILHHVRFGNRPTPKSLKQPQDGNNEVFSIDISPWRMPYLLGTKKNLYLAFVGIEEWLVTIVQSMPEAGDFVNEEFSAKACYSDGSVHLFNLNKETAIVSWSAFSEGCAVIDVKWSRSKPNVFFAIDAQSVLYSWDLLQSDSGPVLEQKLKRKDKRAIGFAFANDYASLGIGTPGRAAEMAIVYGDGSVEIHRLSNSLCRLSADELDRTQQYFDELIC